MVTATQQAVGQNVNRDPPVYPLMLSVGGSSPANGPDAAEAYRWLEQLDSPQVQQFIVAQNKVSAPRLAQLPLRARILERAAQIASHREALPPELQPSRASPEGLLARPAAAGTWEILRAGQPLPDPLRATSVAWAKPVPGQPAALYYGREAHEGLTAGVYLHRVGDTSGQDARVYVPADPAVVPLVDITPDGHYLVITLTDGPERSGIQLLDLRQTPGRAVTLFSVGDARYQFIGASTERLYFQTNRNAPQGRIIGVSAKEPLTAAVNVVPEGGGRLEHAAFIGNRILTSRVEDGRSVVRLYSPEGQPASEVTLPGTGRVDGFGGQSEAFLIYQDYLTPPSAYHVDLASGQTRRWSASPSIDTSAYVTERIEVPGQEGAARVLLDITRRRDRPRDGDQPLILQASPQLLPSFSAERLAWLELGGSYAQVSVHPERRPGLVRDSGLEDLQAAAQYLVRQRYTRGRRLGIFGRGSSGLAVAAALTRNPESYGAVVASLTAAPGDETRPALESGTPFRRVRKGLCYPPTLVTTYDHDSRVAPSDGYQLAARLQSVQLCGNPVLLRVDPRSGPTNPSELTADHWAFMAQWLGIPSPTS